MASTRRRSGPTPGGIQQVVPSMRADVVGVTRRQHLHRCPACDEAVLAGCLVVLSTPTYYVQNRCNICGGSRA